MTKLTKGGLGLLMVMALAGCETKTHSGADMKASLMTVADTKTINTGEVVLVRAETQNLAGGSNIQWTVSPSTARIEPDASVHGLKAKFSADQPGTYIVKAWATAPNGERLSDETTITVNGPMPNAPR